MDLYKFLTDPIWSSVGVILSAVGVFGGAWLGAKLGYKQNMKIKDKEMKEQKQVYRTLLVKEIVENDLIISQMLNSLKETTPVKAALANIDLGAKALSTKVLDAMIANQSIDVLIGQQLFCVLSTYDHLKYLILHLQLEVVDWERSYDAEHYSGYEVGRNINMELYLTFKSKMEEIWQELNKMKDELSVAMEALKGERLDEEISQIRR